MHSRYTVPSIVWNLPIDFEFGHVERFRAQWHIDEGWSTRGLCRSSGTLVRSQGGLWQDYRRRRQDEWPKTLLLSLILWFKSVELGDLMDERGPVHGSDHGLSAMRIFVHRWVQILLTILDCRRLTGLHENVGNVVNNGLASFAKVSNGIDRALFPGIPVGECENGYWVLRLAHI